MTDIRIVFALFAATVIATLALPMVVHAQTSRVYRIAYVNVGSETAERKPHLQAFRAAMHDLGYVEGRNLTVDVRFADNNPDQLPRLVDEVMALRPDVLLGFETVARAMRAKTQTIPVVLTGAFDPVKAGLAESLARPGLNVTGSTQLNEQIPAKHIEILREIIPGLGRVGQLVDRSDAGCRVVTEQVREAAASAGLVFTPYDIGHVRDVERAFSSMQKERSTAVLPCPSPVLFSHREVLFEHALRRRIPLTSYVVTNVPFGVLFAYAATIEEGYQRAALYVDRILKGAKPGDLPIQQPSVFRLVINLKTAKALGLTIPPSVLVRADQVIE